MADKKRTTTAFLLIGLIVLVLVIIYRTTYYANYLRLDEEVVFECDGGGQYVGVHTDAKSWTVKKENNCDWLSVQKQGGSLYITAPQNNSQMDRSALIEVRSGFISALGGKKAYIRVKQNRKLASFISLSEHEVSFPEQGGSETLQIGTDGMGWEVVECPDWITKTVSGNTISLCASDNKGNPPREGCVRVQADNQSNVIAISQSGIVQLEDFAHFMELFCSDKDFQESRVKLPLQYSVSHWYIDDNGEEVSNDETKEIKEWHFERIDETDYYIDRASIELGESSCMVNCHKKSEPTIIKTYFFDLIDNKWYLTGILYWGA